MTARALSDALRARVVKASTEGLSAPRQRHGSGSGFNGDPVDCAARTGELATRPQSRPQGSSLDAHATFIAGSIEERRDITLHEITSTA